MCWTWIAFIFLWISARMWWLNCQCTGLISVLCQTIDSTGVHHNWAPGTPEWRNGRNLFSHFSDPPLLVCSLTHWGRVTHICVNKIIIIGSNNGLSPGQRQAIIWTNAGILLIGSLGTNFSEISTKIRTFSFKKMHLKMLSGKWQPFCLGLNVLNWTLDHVVHIETV